MAIATQRARFARARCFACLPEPARMTVDWRAAAWPASATLVRPVGGLLMTAVRQQPAVHLVARLVRRIVVERIPAERVDPGPVARDAKRVGEPDRGPVARHPEVELVVLVVGRPEQLREEEVDPPLAARPGEPAVDPAGEHA